jgi:hypothetical protein
MFLHMRQASQSSKTRLQFPRVSPSCDTIWQHDLAVNYANITSVRIARSCYA